MYRQELDIRMCISHNKGKPPISLCRRSENNYHFEIPKATFLVIDLLICHFRLEGTFPIPAIQFVKL